MPAFRFSTSSGSGQMHGAAHTRPYAGYVPSRGGRFIRPRAPQKGTLPLNGATLESDNCKSCNLDLNEARWLKLNEPKLWEMLLLSDGSVTRHLQLLTNAQIKVDCLEMCKIGHAFDPLPEGVAQIKGPRVQREVILRAGDGSDLPLVYASSWWNESQVDEYLKDKSKPIWASLSQGNMELYREVQQVYYGHNSLLESQLGCEGPFWGRHYFFWNNGRPLTLIYEWTNVVPELPPGMPALVKMDGAIDMASLVPIQAMSTFFPPAIVEAFSVKNVVPFLNTTTSESNDKPKILEATEKKAAPGAPLPHVPSETLQRPMVAAHASQGPPLQPKPPPAPRCPDLGSSQPANPHSSISGVQRRQQSNNNNSQPQKSFKSEQHEEQQQSFGSEHQGYRKPAEDIAQHMSQAMMSVPPYALAQPQMLQTPCMPRPMPYAPMYPMADTTCPNFHGTYMGQHPILPPPMNVAGMHNRPSQSNLGSNISSQPSQPNIKKRPRVSWTPDLHKRFEKALEKLGNDAVPKQIMLEMKVEGLTRESVASHLQKFRLTRSHVDGASYMDKEEEEVDNNWSQHANQKVRHVSAAAFSTAKGVACQELEGSSAPANKSGDCKEMCEAVSEAASGASGKA
eukprot:gene30892-35939_t